MPSLLVLAAGAALNAAPAAGQTAFPSPPLSIVIRADPTVAHQVNGVLAQYARRAVSRVGIDENPDKVIEDRCGHLASPATTLVTKEPGRSVLVSHSPCILFRPVRELVAGEDATLETLAVVAGLRRSAAERAVVQKQGVGAWQKIVPKRLTAGDRVRFTLVPVWTRVDFEAPRMPTRDRLIELLGAALNCGSSVAEDCVSRKGVDLVLARPPEAARTTPEATTPPLPASAPPGGSRAVPDLDAVSLMAVSSTTAAASADIGMPGAHDFAAATAATTTVAAPVSAGADSARRNAPVAPDQWPYDQARLAAILAANASLASETVVGVADGGLGDSNGLPLPTSILWQNADEKDNEPDRIDDDKDFYVDDLYGAGVLRNGELEANGSLGVCANPPATFDTLGLMRRGRADHGAIVASIAAGLKFRQQTALTAGLPKILFFRLLPDLCNDPKALNASEGAFESAMNYVFERADILVLSYSFSTADRDQFLLNGTDHLAANDYLLIVSAGNDTPGDIDDTPPCPACIADPALSDKNAAVRTLVVGAADRDLTVSNGSNWGVRLVRLYAPGQATGAINVDGQDASASVTSTSWAAPYAALGAGLLRSYGIRHVRDLRERLLAASWPLLGPQGKFDPANSGVLNINMAAAVRHASIEVVSPNGNGSYERRVYVGKLDTKVADLCPEAALGADIHSVHFGDRAADQTTLTLRSKRFDKTLKRYPQSSIQCTLPPKIRFTDLISGSAEFDSGEVTHILLPWL